MKMNQYVDVLIPRGGRGLIKAVVENSTIPVIETGNRQLPYLCGNETADLQMAADIIMNAKVSAGRCAQMPGEVCTGWIKKSEG